MDKFDFNSDFNICSSFYLSNEDITTLSILYLPIIESKALSLYLFFTSMLERNNLTSAKMKHEELILLLNFSQVEFINSKDILEAVGLLSTYTNNSEYFYLLKNPLTPKQFLVDGILGTYLQGQIGEKLYYRLCEKFIITPIDKKQFVDITKSFDDIFESSLPLSKINIFKGDNYIVGRKPSSGINITKHDFDFDEFMLAFDVNLLEFGVTDIFKNQIKSIAHLYGFDENDLHSLSVGSLNKAGYFDYKLLKKAAKALYQTRYDELPIIKKKNLESENEEIRYMTNVTGIELLRKHNPNHSLKDIDLVGNLYEKIKLPKVVVNFLFDYVSKLQSGEIMPINYYVKVSEQWIKDEIITAEKAYNYVNGIKETYNIKEKKPKTNQRVIEPSDWVKEWIENIDNKVEKLE